MSPVSLFSPLELAQFSRDGYVYLRQAFPAAVAQSCRALIEARCAQEGVLAAQRDSWPVKLGLTDTYTASDGFPWMHVFTDRLTSAVDEMCGEGRWKPFGCGWWVVSYPLSREDDDDTYAADDDVKASVEGSWHVDGSHFKHRLSSKEVGLVLVIFFSAVNRRGGGTLLIAGSHRRAGRVVEAAGEAGLSSSRLMAALLEDGAFDDLDRLVELTGNEGDVVIMHPLTLHARSKNWGPSIRYMCFPCVELKEDMDIETSDDHQGPIVEKIMREIKEENIQHKRYLGYAEEKELDIEAVLGFSAFKKTKYC